MTASDDSRRARLALALLAEPNDASLHAAVAVRGPERVLDELRSGHSPLPDLGGYLARLARLDIDGQLGRAADVEARYVVPGDLEWPSQLADLDAPAGSGHQRSAPPLGLWLRGPLHLRAAMLRSAAVVGSRAATAYGLRVASELGSELADRGWSTVSGAAYGVDAAAHRGSLAAQGPTVAVLACGVDQAYPRSHASLLERVAAEGLVVSELPLLAEPTKARFLDRNRVIAGLARGTVLVEAAFRSGALNTTGWARRFGRAVLGLPGPVTSVTSAGVHRELRQGSSRLVTCAADVVADLGSMGDALVEASAEVAAEAVARAAHRRRLDGLPARDRRVLDALSPVRWRVPDELAGRAGVDPSVVPAALAGLLRTRLVEEQDGRWRLAR